MREPSETPVVDRQAEPGAPVEMDFTGALPALPEASDAVSERSPGTDESSAPAPARMRPRGRRARTTERKTSAADVGCAPETPVRADATAGSGAPETRSDEVIPTAGPVLTVPEPTPEIGIVGPLEHGGTATFPPYSPVGSLSPVETAAADQKDQAEARRRDARVAESSRFPAADAPLPFNQVEAAAGLASCTPLSPVTDDTSPPAEGEREALARAFENLRPVLPPDMSDMTLDSLVASPPSESTAPPVARNGNGNGRSPARSNHTVQEATSSRQIFHRHLVKRSPLQLIFTSGVQMSRIEGRLPYVFVRAPNMEDDAPDLVLNVENADVAAEIALAQKNREYTVMASGEGEDATLEILDDDVAQARDRAFFNSLNSADLMLLCLLAGEQVANDAAAIRQHRLTEEGRTIGLSLFIQRKVRGEVPMSAKQARRLLEKRRQVRQQARAARAQTATRSD